jgi:hypothetical protein
MSLGSLPKAVSSLRRVGFSLRRAGLLVVVGAALTGCAEAVTGSAVADPVAVAAIKEARTPLTAEAALGDYSTIDTCSYLDDQTFASYGKPAKPPRPSFEYCTIVLKVAEVNVEVQVGSVVDRSSVPGAVLDRKQRSGPRGLRVMAEPGLGGGYECRRYQKKIKHWTFGQQSLGRINPCRLLRLDDVKAKMGPVFGPRVVANRYDFPSGHTCRWGRPSSQDPHVTVLMQVTGDDVSQGTEEPVAGRPTRVFPVSPSGQIALCALETRHVPFEVSGSTDTEMVTIVVGLPAEPGADPCAVAKGIAETVLPQLPSV